MNFWSKSRVVAKVLKSEIIITDQISSEKDPKNVILGNKVGSLFFPYVDGHKTQLKTTDQLSPERTELVPPLSQRPIPSTLVAQGSYHAQCCHSITRGA